MLLAVSATEEMKWWVLQNKNRGTECRLPTE